MRVASWSRGARCISDQSRTPARTGSRPSTRIFAHSQLPVFENLFLNHELTQFGFLRLLNKRKMRELTRRYLDDINVHVPNINTEAGQLSGGQRQAVAVARATRSNADILLLDEPLAAMVHASHAHHRPREGARLELQRLDDHHRPQLRSPLRALRPG